MVYLRRQVGEDPHRIFDDDFFSVERFTRIFVIHMMEECIDTDTSS